jgi:hypothetical protein
MTAYSICGGSSFRFRKVHPSGLSLQRPCFQFASTKVIEARQAARSLPRRRCDTRGQLLGTRFKAESSVAAAA